MILLIRIKMKYICCQIDCRWFFTFRKNWSIKTQAIIRLSLFLGWLCEIKQVCVKILEIRLQPVFETHSLQNTKHNTHPYKRRYWLCQGCSEQLSYFFHSIELSCFIRSPSQGCFISTPIFLFFQCLPLAWVGQYLLQSRLDYRGIF